MEKFSFKDLAAKAQQAGTKLAAQVKEQQQKYAQKAQEGAVATTDSRPPDEFASEAENALRLVQIQNKALRDRLRASADENERLKDQIHQLTSSTTTRTNGQALIAQTDEVDAMGSSAPPRMTAVMAENEQLREEIAELKDLVRRAEEHAEIADVANQQVKSLQNELAKEREQTAAAIAAAAAAENVKIAPPSSSAHEELLNSLQQQLETIQGDLSIAVAGREAAEAASHQAQEEIQNLTSTLSALQTAQASNNKAISSAAAETDAAFILSEQLRNENSSLQADIEALQQRIDAVEGEKSRQTQEIQVLENQLEEAEAAKEAATAAAAAMEEAVSSTQASVASSSEEYQRTITELEAEVELARQTGAASSAAAVDEQVQKELQKAEESHASALLQLRNELEEQHRLEIQGLEEELTRQTEAAAAAEAARAVILEEHASAAEASAASAAAAVAISAANEDLERRITELEGILSEKDGHLESLQQEVTAAQSDRTAALEELRSELEAQHAQHASQVDTLQEQLTRLRTEHADEVDALREETATLETKLQEAKNAAAAATEASVEEAGWLREGAEELQRQLDASRVESEAALQALQTEITQLKEQLAASEATSAAAVAAAVAAAKAETELATSAEKEEAFSQELAAVQSQVDQMRTALDAAEHEVASYKTGAATALEEKTALMRHLSDLENENKNIKSALQDALNAAKAAEASAAAAATAAAAAAAEQQHQQHLPPPPPPPSYDLLQLQQQLDTLRTENAVALEEASAAAERALVSEAARQEATEQLESITTAAKEEATRLRSDVEAAHQRVAELEASLAIAAAATTATTATSLSHRQQNQGQQQQQNAVDRTQVTTGLGGETEAEATGGASLEEGRSVIERAGSVISASTLSPPLSPSSTTHINNSTGGTASSTGGISGLGSAPMVPHHRRDASYSSEIEPEEEGRAMVNATTSPRTGAAAAGGGSGLPPLPPSVPLAPLPPPALLLHPGSSLEEQIRVLEAELNDSERTHALRDTATAVLKDEIAELRRQQKRAAVDVDYLKAVLVESFASGELNSNSHMLPVLARLLQFSPKDMERALTGKSAAGAGGGGGAAGASEALSAASAAASALFNRWSATTPASSAT